jgi:hypothetical protein
LGEQFFQIRVIFEIQLSWEIKTVRMVDQQDRFYREVLELSKNNTSKHNVLYSKEKVDELIDKVLHAKTVFKSTSSLVTTEIAPNSEETPVVQILNPNNSDNDVQLVEPVKDTAASEIATDITETPIQHARTRALSGQQIQAEKLMRTTNRKLSELSVGNNVIILIPQYDRGPTDPRNILGVIEEVSEYGYRVGTSVGTLSGYLCRNHIEAVNDTSLSISMISSLQISKCKKKYSV